jgi:S-adenosylmethionine synthetase
MVDTFGTGTVPQDALESAVREVFDLTPAGIIQALNLRNPIYRPTAAYGHFGRAPEKRRVGTGEKGERDVELFTWEHVDRVEELKVAAERASRTSRKANV